MYEQSAASVKPDEDTLMNMPINAQKDSNLVQCSALQPLNTCIFRTCEKRLHALCRSRPTNFAAMSTRPA